MIIIAHVIIIINTNLLGTTAGPSPIDPSPSLVLDTVESREASPPPHPLPSQGLVSFPAASPCKVPRQLTGRTRFSEPGGVVHGMAWLMLMVGDTDKRISTISHLQPPTPTPPPPPPLPSPSFPSRPRLPRPPPFVSGAPRKLLHLESRNNLQAAHTAHRRTATPAWNKKPKRSRVGVPNNQPPRLSAALESRHIQQSLESRVSESYEPHAGFRGKEPSFSTWKQFLEHNLSCK